MKRILCYGDSNTFGANPAWRPDMGLSEKNLKRLPEDGRWTKLLQLFLGTEEYEVLEEGLCGRTTVYTDHAWPYCNGRDYIVPCILSKLPLDLIIIMLGTNDMKAIFSPSVDSAQLAISELIKTVKNEYLYEGFSMPKILIVSPIAIGDNLEKSFMYGTFDQNSRSVSRCLPEIQKKAAQMYGCEFFNAASVATASKIDSIHMDLENHRKLAEAICKKVKEILS